MNKELSLLNFYHEAIITAEKENSISAKTAFVWIHDTEKRNIDRLKNILEAQERDKGLSNNAQSDE